MKKSIALLLLAAFVLTGCGSGNSDNDSAVPNIDTADETNVIEAPSTHPESSASEEFENKIMAICKDHGVGYSYHADYNRRGLSDPNVVARQVTCNTIDGRHDYTCEIITEYYEDAGLAREAYDQQRDFVKSMQEISKYTTLLDDDVTLGIREDSLNWLFYCRLYDHYLIYIMDTNHADWTAEIMYDIEELIEE